MLRSFTIAKCRADNTEVQLDLRYSFIITEQYRYPAQTTSHPVTGMTHMPAGVPYFPEVMFSVPPQGNKQFLIAARTTFRENRYEDFRLVAEDGIEIVAPVQAIGGDAQGNTVFTVQPQL